MIAILDRLTQQFNSALVAAFGAEYKGDTPLVVPASNPKFGDYQCNVALSLSKILQRQPREIAQKILDHLDLGELCLPPEIAGPGFINLTLQPAYLAKQLLSLHNDPRLGVEKIPDPQKIVIDFSSPNIAKEMHVGHLRSTIIGDCIARVLEFQGHNVLRLNHVGDWGTQFGMLIAYLREKYPAALTTANALDLGDLVTLYRQAKQRFDEDEQFKEEARQEVVALQAGAEDSLQAWLLLCDQSRKEFEVLYKLLDIKILERGESFYNPFLPKLVAALEQAGIVTEDEGAKCVFLEGFENKEGKPLPLIVQKSDGGYNYATTDLAALQYRIQEDRANRIIYVTDAGQGNHFAGVFQVAKRANILTDDVEVVHVPFGLVLGEDGKKLKTRSGETIRLKELLDEAVKNAYQDLEKRFREDNRTETEEFKEQVAKVVGLGAVKYADLSQNRTSDYKFSYGKMLAINGNTAPYLLYAYVRIQGINRKGKMVTSNQVLVPQGTASSAIVKATDFNWKPLGIAAGASVGTFLVLDIIVKILEAIAAFPLLPSVLQLTGFIYTLWFGYNKLLFQRHRVELFQQIQEAKILILGEPDLTPQFLPSTPEPKRIEQVPPMVALLETEPELVLAKHLLQLSEVIQEVATELLPNRLCQYLFELSQKFNQFYELCPVLEADEPYRTSRLLLCDLTAQTLKLGLSLLGIPVLERM